MFRNYTRVLLILVSITTSLLNGCTKFVEADLPINQLAAVNVFDNNESATAAMANIYGVINSNSGIGDGFSSIGYLVGLEADELKLYNPAVSLQIFYLNSLTPNTPYFWQTLYSYIYATNAVIEGLAASTGVTPDLKKQLTGECKFMRAFLHFYLVMNFGDVPIVTTTDYRVNTKLKRSPAADVYQQIIQDCRDAQADLGDGYTDGSGKTVSQRVRPNKWAATALLARTYLFSEDYADAEAQATSIINNTNYRLEPNLDDVFKTTSHEVIWQVMSVYQGYNTQDGVQYILTSPPGTGSYDVAISPQLQAAFEDGDARSDHWVGAYTSGGTTYYYPYKYKVGTVDPGLGLGDGVEFSTALRLAEQYLIRAEARIMNDHISDGVSDLNVLRTRSRNVPSADIPDPLPPLDVNMSKEDALTAVLHERQVELFTEWGHRWYDLRRMGKLDDVMNDAAPVKGESWQPYKALMPIATSELLANPNLTQTPGY